MACFRFVNFIRKNAQSILFSNKCITKALHRLGCTELCYESKWSTRQEETQGTTNNFCLHSSKKMFQSTVYALNRQLSSETQQLTSCEFSNSKEYLSHVLREISNKNLSPEQYVNIFENLSLFGGGVGHMTTHDSKLFDRSYRNGVKIQHGMEFDQLLVGLQPHIDDLEISSLAKLVKYLVRLGIPVHNKVLSRIFERLLNKESVLSWQDLQSISDSVLLDMKMSCAHPYLFSANFILPKMNILLSNESYMQDMKDRDTMISMMRVLCSSKRVILHCTNMLSKCINCIYQQISDDQLYQDPSFYFDTLRFIHFIVKISEHTKLPNDVFIMCNAVKEKLMNSFIQCAEQCSISQLSPILREMYNMGMFVYDYDTILKLSQISCVCSTQLQAEMQREDLNIKQLSNMIIPFHKVMLLLDNKYMYQRESENLITVNEFDGLIMNHIKYADIPTLYEIARNYYVVGGQSRQKVFKEIMKMFSKCDEKDIADTPMRRQCLSKILFDTENIHLMEDTPNIQYDIVNKLCASFEHFSYTNHMKVYCFRNVLRLCNTSVDVPKSMLEKMLTILPRLDNIDLILTFRELKNNRHILSRDYHHLLCETIRNSLQRRLLEDPSFFLAIMIIKYFTQEVHEGRLDYYSIVVDIVQYLPELIEKMTMYEFRKHFLTFKMIDFVNDQLLESLENFVIRNSIYMKAYDLKQILGYMFHAGHAINNPEFESVCLEKVEKEFDCYPVYYQISFVMYLCSNGILSEKLISRIFSLEYLQGIDNFIQEQKKVGNIKMCGYIQRHLLYLNRTLVLDYPQLQVPWIMENLIHLEKIKPNVLGEQRDRVLKNQNVSSLFRKKEPRSCITTGILPLGIFSEKVDKIIASIFGDDCYKRNTTLSYHYKADFEIYLDDEGNPLLYEIGKKLWTSNHSIQRIAVLLLAENLFCFNSRRLKGTIRAKTRHLQIAGCKVVHIPHYEWNSMAISTTESKEKYLREKIFYAP